MLAHSMGIHPFPGGDSSTLEAVESSCVPRPGNTGVTGGCWMSTPLALPKASLSSRKEQDGWLSPGNIPVFLPRPLSLGSLALLPFQAVGGTLHNQPLVLKVLLSSSTWAGLSGARGVRQGPP